MRVAFTVDVDRARTALPLIATFLRSREAESVAQGIEQRRAGVDLQCTIDTVHRQHDFARERCGSHVLRTSRVGRTSCVGRSWPQRDGPGDGDPGREEGTAVDGWNWFMIDRPFKSASDDPTTTAILRPVSRRREACSYPVTASPGLRREADGRRHPTSARLAS